MKEERKKEEIVDLAFEAILLNFHLCLYLLLIDRFFDCLGLWISDFTLVASSLVSLELDFILLFSDAYSLLSTQPLGG